MKVPNSIAIALVWGALAGLGQAAQAANLFFEGDMVRGRGQEGATGPTCVLSNQFMRKEIVAWRVRVLGEDGETIDDKQLKSLVVRMSDGQTFDMKFGAHPRNPPQTDSFWSAAWTVPADYPTGSLTYTVVATDIEGNTHEWAPFKVGSSQLTVIPGEATFTK